MALSSTEEAQTRALIAQQAAILSLASSEPTIISKLAATKVSLADLTAATSLSDTDLFLVRQGTTEKSVAKSIISPTIPDASETVKGIVELATSAETLTGTDNTRAVHPAGLMSGFVKSFATSGYQKLPSGLIINWGQNVVNATSSLAVTFPISFTTTVRSVTATPNLSSGTQGIGINTLTASGFNLYNGSAAALTINWIAIGN